MFENGGNLVVQEVATQPLTQDLLRSSVNIFYLFMGSSDALTTRRGFSLIVLLFQDCYILDQRGSSVMVWKGKQASKEERREALNRAVVSLLNNSTVSLFVTPLFCHHHKV